MKITASRADLLTALRRAGAAINPNYSPTRSAVLLVAEGSTIQMGATDGTLAVVLTLPGAINEPGRAMLTHKRLSGIITELPEGSNAELSVDSKLQVVIKSATSKRRFTMSGFEAGDYPPVLTEYVDTGDTMFVIDSKSLVSAAGDVKQSVDASRVDGALLETQGKGRFRMLAVGTSLSMALGELKETFQEGGVLIPTVLLDASSAFGGKAETLVSVQQDEHRVRLIGDGCLISCAKLYGGFPTWYEQALAAVPAEPLFRCSAERFLESVRAVSVAADMEGAAERFIQIDIAYKNGECIVSTRKSAKNYGEDELPVTPVGEGKSALIHLDGQRLSLALRAAAPDEVEVFYDLMGAQETFFLKSDAFLGMFTPVRVVDAPVNK